MSRTLYVHVGPRKTATSTIQDALRCHDNSLIIYPKVGLFADGSHHNLVYQILGEVRRSSRAVWQQSLDSLLEKFSHETSASDRNIVISSEVLAESRDVGAFIRSLIPHVGPVDVEIIFVCREHFARAASWYNDRMRAPHRLNAERRISPDEFLDRRSAELCYAPLVRRLRSSGFPVTALNYHPSETWTERFFAHIGLPVSVTLGTLKHKRVGLSTKVLIATIATNRSVRSNEERCKILAAFTAMRGTHERSKFIFGRGAAAGAEKLFGDDRKFLWDDCGIRIEPPDLASQHDGFSITREELREIAEVSRSFGATGSKIVAIAATFVSG